MRSPAGESSLDLPSCAFMGTVVRGGDGRGLVVGHGREHGLRRDRAAPGRATGPDIVPAGTAGVLAAARHRHRDPRGLDLRDQRRARPLAAPVGSVRAGDRRRPDAAAAAGDRDRQPGHRRTAAGAAQGDRQAPRLHRGPRQRPGAVHGQDRHADRGPHLVHAVARPARHARRPRPRARPGLQRRRPATSSTARSTQPRTPPRTCPTGRRSTGSRSTTSASSPRSSSTRRRAGC